jgi:predicted lipid-binding transport protein (Tim44 family)
MGMMGMGLIMVLGITVLIMISSFVIAAISRVARSRLNQEPWSDDAQKAKRDRLILSDDGELLAFADGEGAMTETAKRGRQS